MTYVEHLRFALFLCRTLAACSMASLVHAVFPFLFVTYTSRTLKKLNAIFAARFHAEEKPTPKVVPMSETLAQNRCEVDA